MVLLPVALVCVWAGGWWFRWLVVIGGAGMAAEWATMCGYRVFVWPWMNLPLFIMLAALSASSGAPDFAVVWLLAGAVLTAFGPRWFGSPVAHTSPRHPRDEPEDDAEGCVPGVDLGRSALPGSRRDLAWGFLYIGLPVLAMVWLRESPAGFANTLFILAIIWASDIGAYIVGRLVGGKKLAPAISPGKTWSGAIGGLAAAVLAGFAAAACFSPGFSSSHVIAVTIGLGIVSQAGDLLESALKRHFGVKDSGRTIPGHGGLLDRLDALLAVAPAAAILAFLAGQGEFLWR